MAQRKSTPLRTALSRMFPAALLKRLAAETGAFRRRRRVDPVKLFWVLVLSLGNGRSRSFAALRRSYERVAGERLSSSSFYNRFTPAFTRFLRELVALGLEKLNRCAAVGAGAVLGEIQDILCVDSTVIRLHDALAGCWPACRTNHTLAAVKMHTVLNVRALGPQHIKITSERVADGPALRAGRWMKGRLLLFDLGYFRYALFAAIHRHGGFFLTRLKDNANPILRRLHRQHRGRAMAIEGLGLREVRSRLRRAVLDAEAEICFRRRHYAGHSRKATMRVRIIGLWDEARGVYHWYITNLPVDKIQAEEIGKLYAARWMIELLFRERRLALRLYELRVGREQLRLLRPRVHSRAALLERRVRVPDGNRAVRFRVRQRADRPQQLRRLWPQVRHWPGLPKRVLRDREHLYDRLLQVGSVQYSIGVFPRMPLPHLGGRADRLQRGRERVQLFTSQVLQDQRLLPR